jgi:hypothetical protein
LPQELKIDNRYIQCGISNFVIESFHNPSEKEIHILKIFRDKWEKRFHVTLHGKKTSEKIKGENIRIIVGVQGKESDIFQMREYEQAIFQNLLDCPNPEQAYCIFHRRKDHKIFVFANDEKGLFYGMETLFQIFNGLPFHKKKIAMPGFEILDWPDIRRRGAASVLFDSRGIVRNLKDSERKFKDFAGMKLNFYQDNAIGFASDSSGKLSLCPKVKPLYSLAKQWNIDFIPTLHHMDQQFKQTRYKALVKLYPDAVGKTKSGSHLIPWCYESPSSKNMLKKAFQTIIEGSGADSIGVWLTECSQNGNGLCQCSKCKGNASHILRNEINMVVNAWKSSDCAKRGIKLNLKF